MIEKLRALRLIRAAELVEAAVEETLTYYASRNLAAARLRHIAGTAWSTKRYLNTELFKDHIADFAGPAALEPDAIEVDVRMPALDRPKRKTLDTTQIAPHPGR